VGLEPKRAPGPSGFRSIAEMGVAELEALRLLLRGGSIVDWRRLNFRGAEEVTRFLALNLFAVDDPRDERRLRSVLAQAVDYLRVEFGYKVATPVAEPEDVRDVFLYASGSKEPHRYRRIACVVLKVMQVIHHLEARELLFRTAIREADLAERAHRRIMAEAERMHEQGLPIVEFRGNVKSRGSLVTKLLAKKESVAAQVFDRVRYRVVTERTDQIPSVVLHLAEHLFPFNYAVPGQTQNSLVRFADVLRAHPSGAELAALLQLPADLERKYPAAPRNEFSGKNFKMLNFVVDLPVRVDDLVPSLGPSDELGRVVFSLVEFQIVDRATAVRNEQGESSHERYKKRQLKRVLRRLSRGLVVPKRAPRKRKGAR
jgi:uncharacterized protein (TIGR04552 family)